MTDEEMKRPVQPNPLIPLSWSDPTWYTDPDPRDPFGKVDGWLCTRCGERKGLEDFPPDRNWELTWCLECRAKVPKRTETGCRICGRPLERTGKRGRPRVYCSETCQVEGKRRHNDRAEEEEIAKAGRGAWVGAARPDQVEWMSPALAAEDTPADFLAPASRALRDQGTFDHPGEPIRPVFSDVLGEADPGWPGAASMPDIDPEGIGQDEEEPGFDRRKRMARLNRRRRR